MSGGVVCAFGGAQRAKAARSAQRHSARGADAVDARIASPSSQHATRAFAPTTR